MLEWLKNILPVSWPVTWQSVLLGVVIFVVTFAASLAVVTFLLVKIPEDYFHPSYSRDFWLDKHRMIRWAGLVAKNVVGVLLVLLGVVMSLPGVPGQGVLTILLGVMLLDFPGKRKLELKIVGRPKVLAAINGLRARFGKPPLILRRDGDAE